MVYPNISFTKSVCCRLIRQISKINKLDLPENPSKRKTKNSLHIINATRVSLISCSALQVGLSYKFGTDLIYEMSNQYSKCCLSPGGGLVLRYGKSEVGIHLRFYGKKSCQVSLYSETFCLFVGDCIESYWHI